MIVDVHTHVWQTPDQLGQADLGDPSAESARRGGRGRVVIRRTPLADPETHWQASLPADHAIVLGFKSRLLRAEVPNDYVATYVRRHPDKLIGFAGIDPTSRRCQEDLARSAEELGLRGIVLSPGKQGFHPADTRAMEVYAEAERRQMPILFHSGGHLSEASRLEFARPALLDEVARAFPKLRIVISQMGHPFYEETSVLLAKHPRLYADVGGVTRRPWQAYNALIFAHEHGVMPKLLFASDFPYGNAADTIEALYSINHISQGSNLPTVPRGALREIIERDSLALLSLTS
jgi:predicted TIM-barrel fold metal-dependent hydrolase